MPGMQGKTNQTERQKNIAELKSMQMALMKSMQESRRADPKQVDALLVKIKEVTGSSTVNGIDIDALRNHLARAVEIQRVATEMQSEASKPGGADPKKIKAYTEKLQALQQQNNSVTLFQAKPSGGPVK
jgi:ubiquitin-protein ligase